MLRTDLLFDWGFSSLSVLRRFIRPRYVVLHGYYGAGNVGDEAVLLSSLEQLRKLPGDLTPYVFCPTPERVSRMYGVPSMNPQKAGRKCVARVLLRSSAYLLGGGGLLKDYGRPESRSLEWQWLQWLELAQAVGVRTMLWSVGVENVRFEASKRALRQALNEADVITVRDERSAARMRAVGVTQPVHVTSDPVPWMAQRFARRRAKPARPRVVACMRHWYPYAFEVPDEAAHERMLRGVAGVLDYLVEEHGADVSFLPFRTAARDDDREACRAVQARMRTGTLLHDEADPGVEETMARLAEADLVIGMRLHASIMATAMGIPTVALAYMPKVRDYMTSIGHSTFCIDVEEATRERLAAVVDHALDDYEELSEALLVATSGSAQRFQRNRELLLQVLNVPRKIA